MRNRIQELQEKFSKETAIGSGNSMPPLDFSKIRVGAKNLDDAIFNLGSLKKINPTLADKGNVLRAIDQNDLKSMREIFTSAKGFKPEACRAESFETDLVGINKK